MIFGFQIVMAGAAGLALALAGAGPAAAAEMKGVFAPTGGTSGAHRSGGAVFGKPGAEGGGGTFVAPAPSPGGKGGRAPGFVYEYKVGEGKEPGRHRRKSLRHGFPVIVYPLRGGYGIATGTYDGDAEDADREDAYGADAYRADEGIFAITNGTAEEMTVYDNGKPVCVLAPKVSCSFDVSQGRHDISASIGKPAVRRAIPRAAGGGKTIVVWEALEKAE